jgi:hypothetical protein
MNDLFYQEKTTKKSKFINRLTTLSREDKIRVINFFGKFPVYESLIDWNNKDLQYKDFEKIFEIASRSSNAIKRMEKENPILAFKRHNCKIITHNEQYIIAVPLDWECAVFFNSFSCGGEGARWCIGDKHTYHSWNHYLKDDNIFLLVYFMNKHPRFGKKIIFQYKTMSDFLAIWFQDDCDSMGMSGYFLDILCNVQIWNTGTNNLAKDFNLLTSLISIIYKVAFPIDIREIKFHEVDRIESLFGEIKTYQYRARTNAFDKNDFESIMDIRTLIYEAGNENERKRLFSEIEKLESDYKIGILHREADRQRWRKTLISQRETREIDELFNIRGFA